MKWILFTGTWRLTNKEVEEDVRKAVREVLFNGNGIITGGALGVDLIAVDELIKNDINCKNLRVIIPSKIDLYMTHLWKAVEEGRISKEEFTSLENILRSIVKNNPAALLEMNYSVITQDVYNLRNSEEVKYSDEVYAFQVNESTGTQDTIDKAKASGLTISLHKKYKI